MFTGEIVSLHNQGFTSGAIAVRLGVAPNYVRAALSAELAGRDVKASYVETAPPPPAKSSKEARHNAAVKVRAEAKRTEALRLLAEANAELG
jgi:hypothetical protein